jgi:hypothetical protein
MYSCKRDRVHKLALALLHTTSVCVCVVCVW